MCGIIGYIGEREAQPILLNGLKRLEYRGYDSTGLSALLKNKQTLSVRKIPGKVRDLEQLLQKKPLSGSLGVGHCLTPDTYIFLSDGKIKKISELENHDSVVSIDFENLICRNSTRINTFRHRSPKILYQIKTPYFTFVATGEHRIFAAEPSGAIKEKRIREITDELIAMPRRISAIENNKGHEFTKVSVEKHFIISPLGRLRLKEYRKRKDYPWGEIKKLTGVNSTYIKRIEKGERISIEENRLRQLLSCYNLDSSPELFISDNYITNDVSLPTMSTEESMQILGYFIGDGHITERMIRFKESNKETCKVYQDLFKIVFNMNSNLKNEAPRAKARGFPERNTERPRSIRSLKAAVLWPRMYKKGHYVFVISSRFLADWFRKNFPEIILPMPKKDLPEFVGSLPNGQIAKFLKGLFDAEGAVGLQAGQISIGMVSKKIIQKIQLLLLRFGVLSTYSEGKRREKNWNDVHRLSINDKASMENFEREIGFSSPDKQQKLQALIKTKKHFNYKYFCLPVRLDKFYYNYLRPTKIKGWHKIGVKPEKTYLTNYRLHKILNWINQNGKSMGEGANLNEVNQCVKKFLNSEIVWVRPQITQVPSSCRFVYDLEVKPTSNFIGNGILQHNSRWATHGEPNQINAHPHLDCKGEIALVHNGIIENYVSLKNTLLKEGHKFKSQTDTEVIVHLIEKFSRNSTPLEEAVRKAVGQLEGSYAIGVISQREPDKLVGARSGSPLIVGIGRKENFLASDVPAVLEHTKDIIFLEENEIAILTKNNYKVTDLKGKEISKKPVRITWDIAQAQKQGYRHFMLKEINEQPRISENLLNMRIKGEGVVFEELKISEEKLKSVKNISIVACGTAYHAGLVGKYILEKICGFPVAVDVSSEFRYRDLLLDKDTLVIAISQSGETADTLAGVREAKKRRATILSICNVLGSSLTRECDGVIYTHAGPEIGVASTKAYTAQIMAFYLFSLYFARLKNILSQEKINKYLKELSRLPRLQEQILKGQESIAKLARRHSHFGSFLYLGRNINFPSALEGALKLKEISYIPAEGYAAGEMKHGPIALIDEYRAVVCIATESKVYEKMLSNIQEIHSRRGKIIAIATEGDTKLKALTREVIYVPRIDELFSPLIVALPLQLLAYHIAVKRGCDVDQPRNLAKSVTVE